ncbi:tripartite tricarboxylate transporter TctB family protein [Chelativorans sp. AA-79]|uniref:tripartite tricarboxylate transporter TctB family protein n=1 Tax=Chelativorans sp. AA-79 TaxID=3028735 RepID=UPI0023F61E8C|nr:tripartite tricarboxylate transporter TctB family protein [Chelativorans sp. AA-79]WEX08699.1 tripartite tricarboxylate transporter TctB family protein [Chelativorans sp. AA-79]
MTADRVCGLIFCILGVLIVLGSRTIVSNFPGTGDPGPQLVPLILGGAMTLLGALLALRRPPALSPETSRAVSQAKSDGNLGTPNEIVAPPAVWRRIALGVLLVGYVATFNHLGFSLASFLFLAGSILLLGTFAIAEIVRKLAVAALVVVLLGYALNGLLGLSVPGVWWS